MDVPLKRGSMRVHGDVLVSRCFVMLSVIGASLLFSSQTAMHQVRSITATTSTPVEGITRASLEDDLVTGGFASIWNNYFTDRGNVSSISSCNLSLFTVGGSSIVDAWDFFGEHVLTYTRADTALKDVWTDGDYIYACGSYKPLANPEPNAVVVKWDALSPVEWTRVVTSTLAGEYTRIAGNGSVFYVSGNVDGTSVLSKRNSTTGDQAWVKYPVGTIRDVCCFGSRVFVCTSEGIEAYDAGGALAWRDSTTTFDGLCSITADATGLHACGYKWGSIHTIMMDIDGNVAWDATWKKTGSWDGDSASIATNGSLVLVAGNNPAGNKTALLCYDTGGNLTWYDIHEGEFIEAMCWTFLLPFSVGCTVDGSDAIACWDPRFNPTPGIIVDEDVPATLPYNRSSNAITWHVTDHVYSNMSYIVLLDGITWQNGSWQQNNWSGNTGTVTTGLQGASLDQHEIVIYVRDGLGKSGSNSFAFELANIAPEISFSRAPEMLHMSPAGYIRFFVRDDYTAPNATFAFSQNGTMLSAGNFTGLPNWNNAPETRMLILKTILMNTGDYNFSFFVDDGFGLNGSQSVIVTITPSLFPYLYAVQVILPVTLGVSIVALEIKKRGSRATGRVNDDAGGPVFFNGESIKVEQNLGTLYRVTGVVVLVDIIIASFIILNYFLS